MQELVQLLVKGMYLPFKIFISYPDDDVGFVGKIQFFLERMNIECLIAEHKKAAGEELWDKFNTMIKQATRVLVLYTQYAPQSKWMQREIHMARTHEKKFIPVKEETVALPSLLKGEDKEYIPFRRNDPLATLMEICDDVYEIRLRTPHVVIFTRNGRPTGQRLLTFLKTGRAYWMNDFWDQQVKRGRIQATEIEVPYNLDQSMWAWVFGLELVVQSPEPEELGF